MSEPIARFYRIRLLRGGPPVGLKVWFGYPVDPDSGETLYERSPLWRCQIDGQDDAISVVMIELDGVTREPVIKGDLIDELEYERLCAVAKWARRYDPTDIAANPRKKIDMNRLAPIKFAP